eukprot:6469207-Prymnesium_polylepis.1
MPGAHLGSGRRARRGEPWPWWPLSTCSPCTCRVRYGRTRQLNVHVAVRNGHVAGPAWTVSPVPSHLTASSGAGAHVMDAAAGSDALCGLGCESPKFQVLFNVKRLRSRARGHGH